MWVQRPGHEKATWNGNVREHIAVMEDYLGRPLPGGSIVHHCNRQRHDNRIENLLLMRNEDDHLALHRAMESNDQKLVEAYEKWSLNFMEKLKAGLPLEECYKELVPTQAPASKPKRSKTILRKSNIKG